VPVNLLTDVDVVAISLVNKGANRKRIYLKKSDEELFDLPGREGFLKNSDWSVFYSVVAEPGWRESAGSASPGETIEDEWANEDQIRGAAYRFMNNGALVNKMHESLEPYGQLVENFIAQTDFEVDGETVKKGSWVVGIMPSEEGRVKIDNGDITGISIQGTGLRTLSKRAGPGGDIARNQGKQFGPLKNLIAYYLKKKHPFTACVRDNRKRFGPRAENVCAALKDIGMQTTHWRKGGKKIHKAEDIPEEGFGEAIVIWKKYGLNEEDARMALESMNDAEQSFLQKFSTFLKGEVEEENETGKDEEEKVSDEKKTSADERLEKAADALEKSQRAIETLANNLGTIAQKLVDDRKKSSGDEEEDEGEELKKRFDEFEDSLGNLRQSVEKLAEGQSTQPERKNGNVQKSENPLAGLLFD
jgi:hypothetical protein